MRVTLAIRNAEVKKLLEKLGRRKAVLVESAILHFLKTENGKMLYETLVVQEETTSKTKTSTAFSRTTKKGKLSLSNVPQNADLKPVEQSAELSDEKDKISIDKFFFNDGN